MRNDIASYVACISGAITLGEYQTLLKDAGLPSNLQISFSIPCKPLTFPSPDATFVETKSDLNVYFENSQDDVKIPCCPTPSRVVAWKPSYDINEWVGESLHE
jgi:hypothetical protein